MNIVVRYVDGIELKGHAPTCKLAALLKGDKTKETRDITRIVKTKSGYWQKDFYKLQQENEQLRAQVTQMRKALTVANNYMPDVGHFCTVDSVKNVEPI